MRLTVWVQPGAKQTEFMGLHDGMPKFRVAAKSQDNKANNELCAFLAKQIGISKSQVQIVAGLASRRKILELPDEHAKVFAENFAQTQPNTLDE